jgi:hypothetical protein
MWYDKCIELWSMSDKRPYLKEDITIWDAFKYLYVQLTPKSNRPSMKAVMD